MSMPPVYPPSVFLKEELDSRSSPCEHCGAVKRYTQKDLAAEMGIPQRTISEIMQNKRPITKETAKKLAIVLGTGPEVWLNIQHEWHMSQLSVLTPEDTTSDKK